MEQKEYEIAYGNTFTRVLSTIFHLIIEAGYLFIFNIANNGYIQKTQDNSDRQNDACKLYNRIICELIKINNL